MRPDKIIDIEALFAIYNVFTLYTIFHHEHLHHQRLDEQDTREGVSQDLANICNFEHLLIIESLLRLDDTRHINKFGGVCVVPYVEHTATRVYEGNFEIKSPANDQLGTDL